jgi:hypothetical protein
MENTWKEKVVAKLEMVHGEREKTLKAFRIAEVLAKIRTGHYRM